MSPMAKAPSEATDIRKFSVKYFAARNIAQRREKHPPSREQIGRGEPRGSDILRKRRKGRNRRYRKGGA